MRLGLDPLAGSQKPDPITVGLADRLSFHGRFLLGQPRSPVSGWPGDSKGTPKLHPGLYLDRGIAGRRRMECFMGFLVGEIYQDIARSLIL